MGKRANPMAIKATLTYDIVEAARALGVTPATIRNWIKNGLPVISARKPYLVLGEAIREYLQNQRNAAKRPLEPDQLYCPRCREGRRPSELEVTITQIGFSTSLLRGACEHCGGANTRMIANSKRLEFAAIFRIAIQAGGPT